MGSIIIHQASDAVKSAVSAIASSPLVDKDDAAMAMELVSTGCTECQVNWLMKFIRNHGFTTACA